MHLVRLGHFQSRDNDGGHIIGSTIPVKPHATRRVVSSEMSGRNFYKFILIFPVISGNLFKFFFTFYI